MDMMTTPATATPGAAPARGDNEAGEIEICIAVASDGALTVYKETGDQELAEGAEDRQSAANIGQALKMALDIYRGLGAAAGSEQAGFDSVSKPMPGQRMGVGR